jgi:hypothetical protein
MRPHAESYASNRFIGAAQSQSTLPSSSQFARLERSVTEARSNLTRAEQIELHPLWRRSGRAVRDDREVRDVVKRDRSKVSNHVHERWLRSGAQSRLSFIGACINPAAVRGQLPRTRGKFGLAAMHAIHRCTICEPACRPSRTTSKAHSSTISALRTDMILDPFLDSGR